MKKKLDETAVADELKRSSVFFSRKNGRQSQENSTEAVTQKTTQVSKHLLKRLSKDLSKFPSVDEVEALAFQLRKETKARINADVPQAWKKRLDDLAHELGVGKYELVMYIIAQFLGEAKERTET